MMKNWFTRYHSWYPRSLVYMLQACEYRVGDYIKWYHRTSDFRHVERRKKLVYTPKATALLAAVWISYLALWGMAVVTGMTLGSTFGFFLAFAVILAAPYALAYGILLPLAALMLLQWPIEKILIQRATKQLRAHRGMKIAIAGSFGKTSMREILKTVLLQGKKVAAPPHSYNTPLGISRFAKGLRGDEDILIFEFGEYKRGDIGILCQLVQPQWGVITGINEAHLEKFKRLDETVATVFELKEWLGLRPLYTNGESELAVAHADSAATLYTRKGAGSWRVENAHTDLDGTSFILIKGDVRLNITSTLCGLHQIGPLVAAADIADRLGFSPEKIQKGLAATKAFAHRLEPILNADGVVTLDDSYNGNPDGVNAVIEFLASLHGHRRWYVTPGLVEMGPRTAQVHREIGKKLSENGIEKVVLIHNSVTPYIEEGLKKYRYAGDILWYDDALAAFAALSHLTVKGDVVLLQNDWPDQYQ